MEKSWIKFVLILSFLITLGFVYVGAYRALQDMPTAPINVPAPVPPAALQRPALPANPKSEEVDAYIKAATQAVALDKVAADNYTVQVNAYQQQVGTAVTLAKANSRDGVARLNAFEKVIKDTLGPLILAPLLGALLIYSGIKVSADVAATRALRARTEVQSP